MKKIFLLILSLLLLFTFCACNEKADNSSKIKNESSETSADNISNNQNSKTLVVFFSATGNTKTVAEKIAKIESADLYEIKPEKEYTSADLNWNDSNSRATKEQNDKTARPAISGEKINLDNYSKIYIGFPIWWGEEPRILDTFVESYDFNEKTVIPFCTSGSSGISSAESNLKNNANGGEWKNGKRFSAAAEDSEISSFIDSVK